MTHALSALALTRGAHGPLVSEVSVPAPSPGFVRLRVSLAGLCRTDVEAALGGVPCAEGRVLGHEGVAEVEALGEGVHSSWLGARVGVLPLRPCGVCEACVETRQARGEEMSLRADDPSLPSLTEVALEELARCERPGHVGVALDGLFATYTLAHVSALYPLPWSLSEERAAYVEPVAAALAPAHTLRALGCEGEEVVVWGRGRIAALTRRCLEAFGFEVSLYHPLERLERPISAGSLGCVVETEARREGLEGPMRALRVGGRLVLKSRLISPGGFPIGLAVQRQLKLVGASYAPFAEAIRLLSDPHFEVEPLFGARYPLSAHASAFSVGEREKVFFEPSRSAPLAPRTREA